MVIEPELSLHCKIITPELLSMINKPELFHCMVLTPELNLITLVPNVFTGCQMNGDSFQIIVSHRQFYGQLGIYYLMNITSRFS